MLSDPLLARDAERRYGDVSSLREWAERVGGGSFADPRKDEGGDEFIKVGGAIVVPWIREMNILLSTLSLVMLTIPHLQSTISGQSFTHNPWAIKILIMSLAHIADNLMLQRSAISRHRNKSDGGRGIVVAVGVPVRNKSDGGRGIVVAVGVPVPDVEVGVAVMK